MIFKWIEKNPLTSIFITLAIVYFPFLGTRLIRVAGDEKVYVSQAIEMMKKGTFFLQSIHNEPSYYKGPLHYILILFGDFIFGKNPWAILYMNFFFLLLGAYSVYSILRHRLPENKGLDFFGALFFGINLGLYTHTFTSQMEVELAGLFAFGLYLLDRMPLKSYGLFFWSIAGMIAWLKSPLHSVFLGIAAILFWISTGEILRKITAIKPLLGGIWGIFIGFIGFLPIVLLDWKNFYHTYLLKETLFKSTSGQHWSVTLNSTFGFYLFPWIFFALISYIFLFFILKKILLNENYKKLFLLSCCSFLPSVLFFLYHPYRFENYHLPIISSPILLICLLLNRMKEEKPKLFQFIKNFQLSFLIFLNFVLIFAVSFLYFNFHPSSEWFSFTNYLLMMILALLCLLYCIYCFVIKNSENFWQKLALAPLPLLLSLSVLLMVIGEREILDLRSYIQKHPEKIKSGMSYYNLRKNIWNEWGILNYWVSIPISGIFTEEQFTESLNSGKIFLVHHLELEEFKGHYNNLKKTEYSKLMITPWKRWRTRGQSNDGTPLWKKAFQDKDLSLLERDFYIIEVL